MILRVKLGKIVNYAHNRVGDMDALWKKFLGDEKLWLKNKNIKENVAPLFNEWLIFEFTQEDLTFVSEYYLKNPDGLTEDILEELKQVIQTEKLELLEVENVNVKQSWIEAYALFSGKIYKIYDESLSSSIKTGYTIWGRVAKLNGKYLLCGADSGIVQIKFAEGARKMFLEIGKRGTFSMTDVVSMFYGKKESEPLSSNLPKTKKEIKKQQKKLKNKYQKLTKKYGFKIDFEGIINFIYNERYSVSNRDSDYYNDVIKLMGVDENFMEKHFHILADLWNYFPHKNLDNESPAEKALREMVI